MITPEDYNTVVAGLKIQNRIQVQELMSTIKDMNDIHKDVSANNQEEIRKLTKIISKQSELISRLRKKFKEIKKR